jgi:penicillin-binding protein 2
MVVKYRVRLYLITLILLAGFVVLAQRMWNLTVERHDEFKNKIRGTKTLRARVPGSRGEIRDRNGMTLVANKPSFEVRINLKMLVDEYRAQVREDNKHIAEENKRIAEENKKLPSGAQLQPKLEKRETPMVPYEFLEKGIKRSKDEIDIVSIVNEAVIEPLNQIGLAAPFNAEHLMIQFRTNRGVVPWVYRRDLTFEEFSQFAEHRLGLPGVAVTVRPVRQYLFDSLACHALGYVNQADEKRVDDAEKKGWDFFVPDDYGVAGVEKSFDAELRGRPGAQTMLQDEKGHIVSMLDYKEPRRGNDIWLTLDARVQYIAERALRESQPAIGRGAVVVLDPSNGDVIAMASVPSYNPNKFIPAISKDDFAAYMQNQVNPLFNRAVHAYAPGSTYKTMISFAGILAGTENEHFNCSGGVQYGNKYMKCWIAEKGGSHGTLGLSDGLKNSCNCFFYQYGNRAGIGNIEKAGKMLGMGQKTGIELSDEDGGVLPTPKWLKAHRPRDNWSQASTANTSIGQGDVQASPLQMAGVAAAIGNGGACFKPHLLRKVTDGDEVVREQQPEARASFAESGITPQKLELVRKGMWKVVNEDGGTARAARIGGVEVAGKTGTAQFWRLETHRDGSVSSEKDNHTLFIAFAPYVNPKYAICIFLQGGKSGGGCSAPIAKRVLEQALALDQGYVVTLAPLKEVPGNFNHIEQVSFDGVAPVALAPHEQDNDTGSDADVPRPAKVEKSRPVPANIKHDADAEGSRAINNKQPPPRRAGLFQAPSSTNPGLLRRLFGR